MEITDNETGTLLPAGAMARLLGVRSRWLCDEAKSGRLPGIEAGNTYLFDAGAVKRVLLQRAAKAEGADDE